MSKGTSTTLMIFFGVVFLLGLGFSSLLVYEKSRALESAGIYSFTSTGEVYEKEVRESAGRRKTRMVKRHYATFVNNDKRYSSEIEVNIKQFIGIRNKTERYVIKREVFVDRNGEYVVTDPKVPGEYGVGYTSIFVSLLITLISGGIVAFAMKSRKRYIPA